MKAAVYAAIAASAQLLTLAFGANFFPDWYYLLVALGYGLLLPVLATLHARHSTVKESGAVLATAAGTVTIVIGIAASTDPELIIAGLLVRGIWWWTIGKMWRETGVMPRWLGLPTMVLAVVAIGLAVASAPFGVDVRSQWLAERVILGLWTLALAYALWRTR